MQDFEVIYDSRQVNKYCLTLLGLSILSLVVAIAIYFLWVSDLRLFIPLCLLAAGMFFISIIFYFRMGRGAKAFFVKDKKMHIRGLEFSVSDVIRCDGVLNLGRDNSTEYLNEFCVNPPSDENQYCGDVYISTKDKQYKFSYIFDVVAVFNNLYKCGIETSLIVWAGNSNRRYVGMYDEDSMPKDEKDLEEQGK